MTQWAAKTMRALPNVNRWHAPGDIMSVEPDASDDLYSALPAIRFLDEKLSMLDDGLIRIANTAEIRADLTPVQRVSLDLVPSVSSLGKSIQRLIKEGYPVSALVLFGPLLERIATLAYLLQNPGTIDLWKAGWPHGNKPKLRTRLAMLIPGVPGSDTNQIARFMAVLAPYDGIVHGDPIADKRSRVPMSDRHGYSLDRDHATPGHANNIATETATAVTFLLVLIDRIFSIE
jgi:hypothetical protein